MSSSTKQVYNRVLVCGGRAFHDKELLDHVLNECARRWDIETIIHGAASGADRLAGLWANKHGVNEEEYPANWLKHKRAAGPIRNQQMLTEGKPDAIIAFPGGNGTAHMVSIAKKAGIKVFEV